MSATSVYIHIAINYAVCCICRLSKHRGAQFRRKLSMELLRRKARMCRERARGRSRDDDVIATSTVANRLRERADGREAGGGNKVKTRRRLTFDFPRRLIESVGAGGESPRRPRYYGTAHARAHARRLGSGRASAAAWRACVEEQSSRKLACERTPPQDTQSMCLRCVR